jgi:predicted Zn-dependent protease
MRGDAEVMYREAYHEVPRAQWRELAQRISYNNGFAGDVSTVDASLPEKTTEPFHVSWDYTRKDFGDWENRRFPGMSTWFEGKIADDATAPKRPMRMDPTGETEVKVTLNLPDGYTVTVPSDLKHATAFAEYSSTYMLKDRALTMDRTMRYKVDELPVSEFGAYRAFLKSVSNDAGQMLQLVGASAEAPKTTVRAENSEARELLQQAYVDMQANDVKSARALLDKVKALNDHQLGLWAEYGDVELHDNKDEAVADFKKELDLHPENFVSYQKLATVYMTEGRLSDAEQILQSWKKADPSDPRPHSELGDLMFSEERYKDAVTHFQDALSLSTEPTMLKLSLGRAQLKAGQTDTGEATLHALMRSSSEARVLNGAAYELADAGFDLPADEIASSTAVDQIEELAATATVAEANPENLSKALQTVVELAANWDTLGWIAYKRNQLPEAESYAESAWELMPNIEVGLHLGQIYEAEGKKPDALTTYRLAVKSMPQKPQPRDIRMEKDVEARAAALEAAGIREKQSRLKRQGGNDLAALRTYTISSPLKGQSASAEFLLLMGDNSAEDVRFVKGDETLKRSVPSLLAATYRTPLPASSQAKVLRRGVLTCTTGSKTCELVLLPAAEARMDQ